MPLPQAIHVGYSKAMSTTLQHWFHEHPDIFCRVKTNFFPIYFRDYEKGTDYYASFFEGARPGQMCVESDEHLIVPYADNEWSVNVSNLDAIEKTMSRIVQTLPGVKVVLVIRNQLDMVISKYIQFIRQGGKVSFDTFARWMFLDDDSEPRMNGFRYDQVIELLWQIFDRKNVFVIALEEFRKKAPDVLADLNSFLGLPPDSVGERVCTQKKKNVSPSFYAVTLERWMNKRFVITRRNYRQEARVRFMPRLAYAGVRVGIERLDSLLVGRKRRDLFLRPELQRRIHSLFYDSNKRLQSLLDLDFGELGYY